MGFVQNYMVGVRESPLRLRCLREKTLRSEKQGCSGKNEANGRCEEYLK